MWCSLQFLHHEEKRRVNIVFQSLQGIYKQTRLLRLPESAKLAWNRKLLLLEVRFYLVSRILSMTKYLKSGKTWQFPCLHKARKQCWFASHLIKRDIKSPWSTPEGAQESIAIDKDKFQENNSIKSGINMVVISICEEWNSTLKETLPGIIDNISLPLRWWNHAHNVFFSFLIFGKYIQNITIENITNII